MKSDLPYIIAICNQKGGVAKTTTAVNLAAALGQAKKNTLLIDLDPQGNATMGCGVDKSQLEHSITDLFLGQATLAQSVLETEFKNLKLIGANQDLTAAEVNLAGKPQSHSVLKTALQNHFADEQANKVGKKNRLEFILLDCPPALNILTVNALVAARHVLVPIQCEYYALEGLSALLNTVSNLQASVNPLLGFLGFLRTMYDSRARLSTEVSEQLEAHLQNKVFKTIIPRNIRLAEAPSYGKPIAYFDAASKGNKAYEALCKEVIKRCQ